MGEAGLTCMRVVVGILLMMGLVGCIPSESGKGELESALATQREELVRERRAREVAELAVKHAEHRVQSVRRMGLIFGMSFCAVALFIGAGIGAGVRREAKR